MTLGVKVAAIALVIVGYFLSIAIAYWLGARDQKIEDFAKIEAASEAHRAELLAQQNKITEEAKTENDETQKRLDNLAWQVSLLKDKKTGKPIVDKVFDPNCRPAPPAVVEQANATR